MAHCIAHLTGAAEVGQNRAVLSLLCFVVGGLIGWASTRGGDTVQRVWPIVLRAQILITSATLSLVAAWRLTGAGQLLGPLLLTGGFWVLLVATSATRGTRSAGEASLEAWAVGPNSGFWAVPVATAFAGAAGAMVAVLANVLTTVWSGVCVHFMRRDAPIRQRRATSWVDQSPVMASVIGLVLHLAGHAPGSTRDVLTLAGPLLAFSGAALFTGSAIHPHNLATPPTVHAGRRLLWLSAVRIVYFVLIVTLTSSVPLAVVAAVSGLGAPSFQPVQLAVLYGYRSALVNVAVRWGWVCAPLGLGLAALLRA
jgi:predicted permease